MFPVKLILMRNKVNLQTCRQLAGSPEASKTNSLPDILLCIQHLFDPDCIDFKMRVQTAEFFK